MQIVIEIPEKEFGVDITDKFQDFFKRLQAETENHLKSHTNLVCGSYELETIEMFLNAFKEMQIIDIENGNEVKDLSKRVENIENQMKEDKEEQIKKLKAEIEYAKFRCALPTMLDMMRIR